jgi:hypothetical protein
MCKKGTASIYVYFDNNHLYMCVQSTPGMLCLLDLHPLKSKREFLVHCDVSRTHEGLPFSQIIKVSYVLSSTWCTQNNLKVITNYRLGRMLKEGPVGCYRELHFVWDGTIKKTFGVAGVWICGRTWDLQTKKKQEYLTGEGEGFRLPRPVCR